MPVDFLTAAQGQRYGRFAGEPTPEQLAKYFHLDEADRRCISRRHGEHNKLGFAVQLGTVRFLGTFLAQPAEVPPGVLAYLARQLDISDPACLGRYQDDARWRHVEEIREAYTPVTEQFFGAIMLCITFGLRGNPHGHDQRSNAG